MLFRLLLSCGGSTLTASVNGSHLATVEDTVITTGLPFLYGGAHINQSGISEARFAQLLVVSQ